ncbi:MAG: NeuD/PglB/VioB family sugar acetyltransferase [Pseudomonadota bacterium]
MKTIIIGAGGFGQEIFAILKGFTNVANNTFLGFLDDNLSIDGVIGPIEGHKIITDAQYVCAIGNAQTKLKICQDFLSKGADFPTLIHSSVNMASTASFGRGTIISPGCYIAHNATFGDFVLINANSVIGHDATVGDGSTICPNCTLAGHVVFRKRVFMGSNAAVYPGKTIGDDVTIGMGSAVTRNFLTPTTVMGVPAKRIVF